MCRPAFWQKQVFDCRFDIGTRDEVDVLESDRSRSPHRKANRTARAAGPAIDIGGCVRESGTTRAATRQYTARETELEARRSERLLSTCRPEYPRRCCNIC